ncbi:hypothetical protein E6W39_19765 [Kitasatospora acidiphila]|uniref:Uncharacterized protein n=1 Tax=Kitasatospora acidiphila TaxID=2567942 RepID=A0A540W4Y2_9ACTN|nr:hypothetical protein [Kitasatospora acidiphila]TQF04060.1 hypothetical protein E6W39_19765 [Kitasatospora acidiphila]
MLATDQASPPGATLTVNVCRGTSSSIRLVQDAILEAHITDAGQQLAVLHPDVVIPRVPDPSTAPAPAPADLMPVTSGRGCSPGVMLLACTPGRLTDFQLTVR